MNSVTGSRFVAKCLNMIADPSFVNSVTGSGFVAKCSNILQDSCTVVEHSAHHSKVKCLSTGAAVGTGESNH